MLPEGKTHHAAPPPAPGEIFLQDQRIPAHLKGQSQSFFYMIPKKQHIIGQSHYFYRIPKKTTFNGTVSLVLQDS